jgi:hypothetical protein
MQRGRFLKTYGKSWVDKCDPDLGRVHRGPSHRDRHGERPPYVPPVEIDWMDGRLGFPMYHGENASTEVLVFWGAGARKS